MRLDGPAACAVDEDLEQGGSISGWLVGTDSEDVDEDEGAIGAYVLSGKRTGNAAPDIVTSSVSWTPPPASPSPSDPSCSTSISPNSAGTQVGLARFFGMRRVPRLLAAALAVMVVLAGALPSVVLASDIASVKRACDGTVPLFESIVVETARRSWRPPVVRCTLVDRAGDSYTETLWGWDELGVLAALDVAGMTLVATGLRRRRNRGTLSSGALADRRASPATR